MNSDMNEIYLEGENLKKRIEEIQAENKTYRNNIEKLKSELFEAKAAATLWKDNYIANRTLRDEFAMAALNAVVEIDDFSDVGEMAKGCYEIADAMLEARKAKGE